MRSFSFDNVNEALKVLMQVIQVEGVKEESRAGDVLAMPTPVAVTYLNPLKRVLLSEERDANPFFHVMESLWILAGREDVAFLKYFNKRMASFSDNGVTFHGPYGHRLRNHFGIDQISMLIKKLRENPKDRRTMLSIWDPASDLDGISGDIPCNDMVHFRIVDGKLNMMVFNRSNDLIWGMTGANAVQFSFLLEYVACAVGVEVGTYTQVTGNLHAYTDGPAGEAFEKCKSIVEIDPYDRLPQNTTLPLFESPMRMLSFNLDTYSLFQSFDDPGLQYPHEIVYASDYFRKIVSPMLIAWAEYKANDLESAIHYCGAIGQADLRIACTNWMKSRKEARDKK